MKKYIRYFVDNVSILSVSFIARNDNAFHVKTQAIDDIGNCVYDDGAVKQVNHYYPYGGLMGESRSGDVNRYKYAGNELDREIGLNLYYCGARLYDALTLRFSGVDPLAENYPHLSPYVNCANNPLRFSDPTGLEPVYNRKGKYLGSTSEGFTGEILIYTGTDKIDFSKFTRADLVEKFEMDIDIYNEMRTYSAGGIV